MAEVFEVPVGDDWVDINTASGITSGTAIEVMNKGNNTVFLTESVSIPTEDNVGKVLTNINRPYAVADILTGSDTIWARCASPRGSVLAVQEIV